MVASSSISSRLRRLWTSTSCSSVVAFASCGWRESAVGVGIVAGSIGPRLQEASRLSSRVPWGWMGSYSEVASCPPESLRMILLPPGWDGRNFVTSQTLP